MEPALHEQSPLHAKGGDQEVEAHAAEAVALKKGHEEAEPDEDHDVDVLEAWRKSQSEADHHSIQLLDIISSKW